MTAGVAKPKLKNDHFVLSVATFEPDEDVRQAFETLFQQLARTLPWYVEWMQAGERVFLVVQGEKPRYLREDRVADHQIQINRTPTKDPKCRRDITHILVDEGDVRTHAQIYRFAQKLKAVIEAYEME